MLRIKALGSLTVVGPDGPIVNAASQPKRLALLAVIARAGERGITRDKALGFFWPDAEEDRARRSLANAVWAIRRDLGSDDIFLPGNDLRLNPELVTSDVGEFDAAIARGDLARAATLYEGPFLDGFRLVGAPEFDRWVEWERNALTHQYLAAAEKLARAAESKGDADAAVQWWRRITAQDPLNSRLALGLMRALVSAGDQAGAVRHAQIYEALMEQELDLPPDRQVIEYARELRGALATAAATKEGRETSGRAAPTAAASVVPADEPLSEPSAPAPFAAGSEAPAAVAEAVPDTERPVAAQSGIADVRTALSVASAEAATATPGAVRPALRLTMMRLAAAAVVLVVAVAVALVLRGRTRESSSPPVIALGQIADYRKDRSTELVKPLTDMLATALARSTAIQVVSTARMYELTNHGRDATSREAPDAYVTAARSAGATELLDGALYAVDDSTLRLDLRRTDLATGKVRAAHSVVARDAFALADSGTSRLLASFGADAPAGSVADVTTRSLAAYRFYDEGLRAFYQDDLIAAERLFTAALAEDSTFASAAYYLAISYRPDEATNSFPMLERAVRLSARASDRERLTIRARWEERTSSPTLHATAESLLVRYPQEVEGYFFTGIVRIADGDFLGAAPYLERVIAMDSLSLHGERAECHACEAFQWLGTAYVSVDSLERAVRTVYRWRALQPRSGLAYAWLVEVLERQNRFDEAVNAWRERSRFAPGYEANEVVIARLHIYSGEYAKAEELLRSVVATGTAARRIEGSFLLALNARYQGRLRESLAFAEEEDRASRELRPAAVPPKGGLSKAQALFDLGRGREASAIFDAFARWNPGRMPAPEVAPGLIGRHRAWSLTHAASALASVGDTATLGARADTSSTTGAALSPGSIAICIITYAGCSWRPANATTTRSWSSAGRCRPARVVTAGRISSWAAS